MIQHKPNFAQVKSEYTYVQLYWCVQGSPAETQNPTHWNTIGHSTTAYCLCYCPAVLFRHICLIALSFTYGKIGHALKNVIILYFFKIVQVCECRHCFLVPHKNLWCRLCTWQKVVPKQYECSAFGFLTDVRSTVKTECSGFLMMI